MTFSLKVMGIITSTFFCMKKTQFWKLKRIVSVYKHIHVHPMEWYCTYVIGDIVVFAWWVFNGSLRAQASMRACLFGTNLFKMIQSLQKKQIVLFLHNFIFLLNPLRMILKMLLIYIFTIPLPPPPPKEKKKKKRKEPKDPLRKY